jgi:hypothetical protein
MELGCDLWVRERSLCHIRRCERCCLVNRQMPVLLIAEESFALRAPPAFRTDDLHKMGDHRSESRPTDLD